MVVPNSPRQPSGPPRIGGMGPLGGTAPRRPGVPGSPPGMGTSQPPMRQARPSGWSGPRMKSGVFWLLVVTCIAAVGLVPFPPSHLSPTLGIWLGAGLGAFGCSVLFGVFQFLVNQQHASGTYSDWAFPISSEMFARAAVVLGWLSGGINCYLIAHHLARSIA